MQHSSCTYNLVLRWNNSNLVSKCAELFASQTFSEDVSGHFFRRTVLETNVLASHLLTNEMMFNVNVFGAAMKLRVVGHGDGGLVVLEYCGWLLGRITKIAHELPEPH